jgi:hypothetical protein
VDNDVVRGTFAELGDAHSPTHHSARRRDVGNQWRFTWRHVNWRIGN